MVLTIEDVARALEELAPPGLAETWDRSGLQVGDPQAPVHAVLVALDPSPEALAETLRRRAQLLVTHHPLLLEPLRSLDLSAPLSSLLADFIRSDVGVYAAHTNLDRAQGGVNDALARRLGLGEVRCLGSGEPLYKLVVTVPLGYEDPVRGALAAAGAGKTARYEGCGFGCRGVGVFVPREGARPFLGEIGREERAEETRWEVVVRRSALPAALAALRREHPYEEPAVDVYPLEGTGSEGGLGRWGVLPAPQALGEWARGVAQDLGARSARLVGDPDALVERVGVCGGSGASLWPQALAAGVQVLVTGDVKYHAALEARQAGLALLDVGHAPSEQVAVEVLAAHLASWAHRSGAGLEVSTFREADPFVSVEISSGPAGARSEKTRF